MTRAAQIGATRVQRLGWQLLSLVAGGSLAAFCALIAPDLESRLLPVVTDFEVASTTRMGATVTMEGTMHKRRDCRFVEFLVYQVKAGRYPIPLTYDFSPARDVVASRLPMPQVWGPWAVQLREPKPAHVLMAVRHQCHPFYYTTTILATVEVK